MAFLGQVKYNLKETGTKVVVPNDPRAKLMYYLNSICSVLELDDNPDINRLRRYQNYCLNREDRDLLIQLCILLKPDILLNKCIFQNDGLCKDSANKFYELEQLRNTLLVAGNIMIGGRNRRVTSIMTFKMSWLNDNWTRPMQELLEKQRQEKLETERQQRLERQRQARLRQARKERERQDRLERERQEIWERDRQLERERQDRLERERQSSACIIL